MSKKYYSQRDKRWANQKIGNSNSTIGMQGCFGTALGNLCGKTPPEVFEILEKNGYLQNDLIISSQKMAALLGLEYNGKDYDVKKLPKYRTIAEVDMSPAPGEQMHFVVIKEDGSIIDSWTGTIRPKGTYPLVSYRLFKKPDEKDEPQSSPETQKTPETTSETNEDAKTQEDAKSDVPEDIKSNIETAPAADSQTTPSVEHPDSGTPPASTNTTTNLKYDNEKKAWIVPDGLIKRILKWIANFLDGLVNF